MTDLKRRSMRNAQSHAMDVAAEAQLRGFTAADLFGAFAQMVANQNPALARKSLEALDKVVRARVPIIPAGETMPINAKPH